MVESINFQDEDFKLVAYPLLGISLSMDNDRHLYLYTINTYTLTSTFESEVWISGDTEEEADKLAESLGGEVIKKKSIFEFFQELENTKFKQMQEIVKEHIQGDNNARSD